MPQDFLDLYKIRRELYPEYEGIVKKQSIYNSKLIKGNCELCDQRNRSASFKSKRKRIKMVLLLVS